MTPLDREHNENISAKLATILATKQNSAHDAQAGYPLRR